MNQRIVGKMNQPHKGCNATIEELCESIGKRIDDLSNNDICESCEAFDRNH